MANYADAALNSALYTMPDYMNRAEFKHKPSPVLMKYIQNTQFLIPATEMERALAVKNSDQQTVKVNTLNKQSITTAAARAAAHTGSKNDSRVQTVSFTTTASKFKYSIKSADRNIWNLAQIIQAQILSGSIAIHEAIETALLARLNTKKTQVVVSATPRSGSWDGTNYIFQVDNADEDYFIQKAKGFMREQYYKGVNYDAIVDEYLYQKYEVLANQGSANATNFGFQIAGVNPGVTQELTLDSGYVGMGYIFPIGSVGVVPWIPEKNRSGWGSSGENGGLYTSIPDPLGSGLRFAIHQYQSGADNESNDGETQDVDVQVEMSIDYGPVEANSSTSNLSPIVKFGVLT